MTVYNEQSYNVDNITIQSIENSYVSHVIYMEEFNETLILFF